MLLKLFYLHSQFSSIHFLSIHSSNSLLCLSCITKIYKSISLTSSSGSISNYLISTSSSNLTLALITVPKGENILSKSESENVGEKLYTNRLLLEEKFVWELAFSTGFDSGTIGVLDWVGSIVQYNQFEYIQFPFQAELR